MCTIGIHRFWCWRIVLQFFVAQLLFFVSKLLRVPFQSHHFFVAKLFFLLQNSCGFSFTNLFCCETLVWVAKLFLFVLQNSCRFSFTNLFLLRNSFLLQNYFLLQLFIAESFCLRDLSEEKGRSYGGSPEDFGLV